MKIPAGGCKEDGAGLVSEGADDRTSSNGLRLQQGKLRLDIRRMAPEEGGEAVEQAAQGGAGASILEVFKTQVDKASGGMVQLGPVLLGAGVGRDVTPEVSSTLVF